MTWKIHAISTELMDQEISIDRDMWVGRHQTADIVLQQAEISRKHAAFLLKEHALWLQDLGSSNGTFVNDMQIATETLLKHGDIVQFASLKFSVLAPAQPIEDLIESVDHATLGASVVEEDRVAAAETSTSTEPLKTEAQHMNDQGMPELKDRDANVNLSRDGMPQHVGIPKPAPIPEGVDLSAPVKTGTEAQEMPKPSAVTQTETQKNASVGLISMIVLIILAIIAWLMFK